MNSILFSAATNTAFCPTRKTTSTACSNCSRKTLIRFTSHSEFILTSGLISSYQFYSTKIQKHGWGHFDFIIYHHLLVESLRNYSFFIKRALKNIFSNTKRPSKSFHVQLFSGLRDRSRERGLRRGRGAAWGGPGPDSQKRQNGSDRRSNGQRCLLPTPQRRKVQAGTRRPGLISSKKLVDFKHLL